MGGVYHPSGFQGRGCLAEGEDPTKVAAEYCREIATIIVTQAADYEPDGTIPYDNDPCNVELPEEM